MMAPQRFKVLLLMSIIAIFLCDAAYTGLYYQPHSKAPRFRLRLPFEGNHYIIVQKHARHRPITNVVDKFNPSSKAQKKQPKHLFDGTKLPSPDGPKGVIAGYYLDDDKNLKKEVIDLTMGPFRPVPLVEYGPPNPPLALTKFHHHHDHDDDVKPVTENIQDDLKFDFRTNEHSF